MNLQFYLEKLRASEEFVIFIRENPDAFACSGFFCLDKEGKDNKIHFDYFVPSTKEIFSFQLEESGKKMPLENIGEKIPEKISLEADVDFDFVEKMILAEMELKGIKNKIQKLIFSLQKIEGNDFLVGTIFISGLGIIKVNFDIAEKKITDFQKKSFFDMMSVLGKGKV